MAYQCPLHNWFSWDFPCPACVTTVTSTDTDILLIAPQNFDNIPIYISNLPLNKVKFIRSKVNDLIYQIHTALSMFPMQYDESTVLELAGYIMELTELNKDQK